MGLIAVLMPRAARLAYGHVATPPIGRRAWVPTDASGSCIRPGIADLEVDATLGRIELLVVGAPRHAATPAQWRTMLRSRYPRELPKFFELPPVDMVTGTKVDVLTRPPGSTKTGYCVGSTRNAEGPDSTGGEW